MKTRKLTIIAQDPVVKNSEGRILRAKVEIPREKLGPGPTGYRVCVIDYDASQRILYKPKVIPDNRDPYDGVPDSVLLNDPGFHSQNVYAIIMRLLYRFEQALGRRISWGFSSQQLNVIPHGIAEANAFYSDDYQGLVFGYFPGSIAGEVVFSCLSHDIIVHEASHALLDGLRESYTAPSHPDQEGFHEGFADIVTILSIFGLRDVVGSLLAKDSSDKEFIETSELHSSKLRNSVLLGLAEQFGRELSQGRADCLRRAVGRKPRKGILEEPKFEESHFRGEILSAAVLNSFIDVWRARLETWLPSLDRKVPIDKVTEDAGDAANQLLNICIRALDYCPVVDISFSDFLTSLLTADHELLPQDGKYKYRDILRKQFGLWNIFPLANLEESRRIGSPQERGIHPRVDSALHLDYDCVHRESLEKDHNEVFRFLWENREALEIYEDAHTWVISLRPCIRTAADGFILKETVSEYRQTLELTAGRLREISKEMQKPEGMPDDTPLRLNGGGVLVFDEFGRLKYHIPSRINDPKRQSQRLEYLWKNRIIDPRKRYGFGTSARRGEHFRAMHDRRAGRSSGAEEWP